MTRCLHISFDRSVIIVGWLMANGALWIPWVGSRVATTVTYGFVGYYEVTTLSSGETSGRFVASGVWASVIITFLWTAASIRWWQLEGNNALSSLYKS